MVFTLTVFYSTSVTLMLVQVWDGIALYKFVDVQHIDVAVALIGPNLIYSSRCDRVLATLTPDCPVP